MKASPAVGVGNSHSRLLNESPRGVFDCPYNRAAVLLRRRHDGEQKNQAKEQSGYRVGSSHAWKSPRRATIIRFRCIFTNSYFYFRYATFVKEFQTGTMESGGGLRMGPHC